MKVFVFLSITLAADLASATLLPLLSGLYNEHEAGVYGIIASSPLQLCDLTTDTNKDVSEMIVDVYMPGDKIGRKYPIHEAAEILLSDPDFNKNLPLITICPGFNTKLSFHKFLIKGCDNLRCNHNIIILNHYAYTKSGFIAPLSFSKACNYLHSLAKAIAEFLAALIAGGLCLDKLHCIGHSFGAHAMGVTGQIFTALTDLQIPRCTGLDPCGPCMNVADNEFIINSNDCGFVDCHYSNYGQMGHMKNCCDANFYANGQKAMQPGCCANVNLLEESNPDTMICNHLIIFNYYMESMNNANSTYACECPTWEDFESGQCSSARIVRAGHYTTRDVKGTYIYRTNSKAKFTLGRDGAFPCKNQKPKKCILSPSLL